MKKISTLTITIILSACLTGCGGSSAESLKSSEASKSTEPLTESQTEASQSTEASIETQTEATMGGLANPWKYDVPPEDVKKLTGAGFTVPEGAVDVAYGIMEKDKLAEMNFTLKGKRFSARMKPTTEFEDISGLFYEWDAEGVDEINGSSAEIRQFFAETINSVLWFDGKMMYSLYTSEGDKESDDVVELAKLMAGAPKTSEAESDGVIIDENGVSVTDMEIMINTPETCSFDFTLNNPSGNDVTFDKTRLTLQNSDGTELKPFEGDSTPIDASSIVERHSFTMDAGNLKGGDEVSVYFDGKYITSIIVKGGPKSLDDEDMSELENYLEGIDIEEYMN